MKVVKMPIAQLKDRIEEFQSKFRSDIHKSTTRNIPDGELIPAREVPFSLDYIKDRVNRSEDCLMFELIARGRKVEDVENAAEEVVRIIEKQKFTVAESMIFMQMLEEMVLASPVTY